MFKADLLTFWFSLFGLFLVEVPKGDHLLFAGPNWASELLRKCLVVPQKNRISTLFLGVMEAPSSFLLFFSFPDSPCLVTARLQFAGFLVASIRFQEPLRDLRNRSRGQIFRILPSEKGNLGIPEQRKPPVGWFTSVSPILLTS